MRKPFCSLLLFYCFAPAALATEVQNLQIAYLTQAQTPPPTVSHLQPFAADLGLQGAQLAIKDNNTTGQFTGQQFQLQALTVPIDGDLQTAVQTLARQGIQFVVANLPSPALQALAASDTGKDMLWFDAAGRDDANERQCFGNVLHMLPSRAMRADALAQYLLKKRWNRWFLAVGQTPEDQMYAKALQRAAQRYGASIVAEKSWTHNFQERRTDEQEVAVFTQQLPDTDRNWWQKVRQWFAEGGASGDYDVLVVVDEPNRFGEYFNYRTWLPRPVVGTHGLVSGGWHEAHEAWGAVQLQNRFKEQAGRWMAEEDYGAYLAVRALGEAATRTHGADRAQLQAYLLGAQFTLQGYKGKPLSFRPWNGQLRQPVLLATPRNVVAVAPIDGFLHPKTELDTLGYDQPEVKCP